jgi:type I restriction enzyme M protein
MAKRSPSAKNVTTNDNFEILASVLDISPKALSKRVEFTPGEYLGQFSLLSTAGNCFAVVILASSHQFNLAEAVLKSELDKSPTAGVGVLADPESLEKRFVRRRFDRAEFEYVTPYDIFTEGGNSGESAWIYSNGKTSGERLLTLLSEKVEGVFFDIHCHFRDIDGLHADEALDELCKVLYTKLYDEEHTPKQKPYRMQRRAYGSSDECAADVRALYFEAAEYDSRVYEMKIPGYARSRGVFVSPIRLSNPALVKAVEALQSYHLGASSFDVKGRAFQKVIGPTMRSGMGQYFTPDPVVRFLCRALHPTVRELILDPFCGSGHFLTASLELVRSEHGVEDKAFHEFAFGKLHGIEKSDRMVRIAMTDMRLHGDGHSNIRCADSLLSFSNYPDLKPSSFDVILTNPPFGSILSADAIRHLGQFHLSEGRNGVPLEILGVERSLQLLRPGGRMGVILPDGIAANRNTSHVRHWLADQGKVRGVISLPIETFVPFGASIKTCILIVRKWEAGENKEVDYPVFLGKVDNVGYDGTGKSRDGSDLIEVVEDFENFILERGW